MSGEIGELASPHKLGTPRICTSSRSPLRLLAFLEEDKGSDYDVSATRRVFGRGRVDAGAVE